MPEHTTVRGIPADVWRKLRVEAVKQGLTVGALLTRYIEAGLRSDQARWLWEKGEGE